MEKRNGGGGGDVGEGYSSSVDLSSVPDSEIARSLSPTPNAQDSNNDGPGSANSTIRVGGYPENRGVENRKKAPSGPTQATTQPSGRHTTAPTTTTEIKVKKPRKKREPKPEAEKKEKPARKPRTSSTANPNPRKKQKVDNSSSGPNVKSEPVASSRQSKITDLVTPTPPIPQPAKTTDVPSVPPQPQIGINEAIVKSASQQPTPKSQPAAPPRPGGTNYDPIRSSFLISSTQSTASQPSPSPARPPPSRASESPALAGLMNPQPSTNAPASGSISYPSLPRTTSTDSQPAKPTISSPSNRHVILDPTPPAPPAQPAKPTAPTAEPVRPREGPPSVMSVDSEPAPQPVAKPATLPKQTSSSNPSNAPSPKPPVRAKDIVPPLPQGSGLISSALFGGVNDAPTTNGTKATPNIILEIPLLGQSNKVVNFARLAEEKYGFAALHPRVAAQKERLARVAAASAALERNSSSSKKGTNAENSAAENESNDADDMSLDLSDNDGDVAMSGAGGDNSGAEGTGTGEDGGKKKRQPAKRKKIEEYDREDPFVDDSEMVWEATAAASKDGFFVYYGPLVPEGEKPSLEKADGTSDAKTTTGRSAARGRGSRARGGGTAGSRSKKDKDATKDTSATKDSTTNSKDDATNSTEKKSDTKPAASKPRVTKPRPTKAEKEAREKEKLEREKLKEANDSQGKSGGDAASATGIHPTLQRAPPVKISSYTGARGEDKMATLAGTGLAATGSGGGGGGGGVNLAPKPPAPIMSPTTTTT